MNKVIITGVLATALTGCMHTSEGYRKQAPTFEASSDKKPEAVLGCINEAWGRYGVTKSYTPLANGGSISLDLPTMLISTGNKFGIVDAETVDGHTRVRVYGIKSLNAKGDRRVLDGVKGCL